MMLVWGQLNGLKSRLGKALQPTIAYYGDLTDQTYISVSDRAYRRVY